MAVDPVAPLQDIVAGSAALASNSAAPEPNCKTCGAANPMRFRFCAACGSPIALPAPAPQETGPTERSKAVQAAAQTPGAVRTRPPAAEPPRGTAPGGFADSHYKHEGLEAHDGSVARSRSPVPPVAAAIGTDRPTSGAGHDTKLRGDMGAPPKERASLRLTRLGRDGRELGQNVVYDTFDIGRTEGNLVLPEDATLSPRHARIMRDGTRWQLVDLRSSNGTFLRVRGESGTESRHGLPLVHGSTFWVGHQLLRFEILGRAGLGAARLDDNTLAAGVDDSDVRARVVVCSRAQLSLDTVYMRGGEFTIGRETGHMVFPTDGFMSRRHASIRQEDAHGTFRLYDLGSSNGTFVRIQGDAELVHRDQLRVGDQVFRAELPTNAGKDSP